MSDKAAGANDLKSNSVAMRDYPSGLTVRELKDAIKDWPEINEHTGEECEVWLTTGDSLTSIATGITPLNKRNNDGIDSADILFETAAVDA